MKQITPINRRIVAVCTFLMAAVLGMQAQAWQTLGGTYFTSGNGDFPSIVLDPGGKPYVAYRDIPTGGKLSVKRWNGTSWINVGTAGFSGGGADQISITLGTDGRPWVAYRDGANGNRATVKRWTGSSWVTVGTEGFSNAVAYYNCLGIAADGTAYLAYQDGSTGQGLAVVRYWDGSAWSILGGAAISAGYATYLDMALDGDGYPVVGYQDANKGMRTTVQRWDGTAWNTVGTAGFGQHGSHNSLTLDSDGDPYVAYRNLNNSTMASVMKWNGSTWDYVGVNGFSDGAIRHICVAMGMDDKPVVAYTDVANDDRVTVKRWDGTNWVTSGSSGFTAQVTVNNLYSGRWLAIDNVGRAVFAHAAYYLYMKRNTCAGDEVVVSIQTDAGASQTTWEIVDADDQVVASGGPYSGLNNTTVTESVCLTGTSATAWYGFRLLDSNGDGITNGGWELRTPDGKLIMRDAFDVASGSSPMVPGHTPSYGAYHTFALPIGPVDIHPDECEIWDNQPDNKVYAVKQGGKNYQGATLNYQFEFINPDSGRVRRTKKPRNYVLWSELTNPDLVANVKYYARVRTDKSGPLTDAHWGAGCEMSMGAPTACTGLIDDPNNQYYSCGVGVERRFRPNSQIFAWPVYGATKYKFRIFNLGEGYDQEFVSNNYKLELSWPANVAPKLRNGYTYQVQVSALVNGVWTAYCASCPVTINNNPSGHLVEVFGDATLWPNPARDGQVNLNIDDITSDMQHITVDVKDIYGQHVYGQEFGNTGDRFNTVLDLPGDMATGVYLVNITINGEVTTKRLSIIR